MEGETTLKWDNELINADIQMEAHARTHGKAILKIYYYKEGDVIKRVLEENPVKTRIRYYSRTEED